MAASSSDPQMDQKIICKQLANRYKRELANGTLTVLHAHNKGPKVERPMAQEERTLREEKLVAYSAYNAKFGKIVASKWTVGRDNTANTQKKSEQATPNTYSKVE